MIAKHIQDTVEVLVVENDHLSVSIAPALGGKIVSVFNKVLKKEFLWTNRGIRLSINTPGSEYDPNFTGGIDELLPNDLPETIDGIDYPDHGELWTTPLSSRLRENAVILQATLALSGLFYSKTLTLDDHSPAIHLSYQIRNDTSSERSFLWKLHAALRIQPGDRLISRAALAQVVDPEYSRFKRELTPFKWPVIENTDASVIPARSDTVDFFYLYGIPDGRMALQTSDGHVFGYLYDTKMFPYQWWFASYGGFLEHYTAILEPCTNMPMSVNEARRLSQSAVLQPGESMTTSVTIFAGKDHQNLFL